MPVISKDHPLCLLATSGCDTKIGYGSSACRTNGGDAVGAVTSSNAVLPPSLSVASLLAPSSAAHASSSTGDSGKSIPIHVVVEDSAATVDLDSYAIVKGTTLFSDIVGAALGKLGYSNTKTHGAKGMIQIKNWRSLSFDTISDNPDATVESILGDITSVATLKIRLCTRKKLTAADDVKEKLLQFMLQHNEAALHAAGCPIDKATMARLSAGETLSEETRRAFQGWFGDQMALKAEAAGITNSSLSPARDFYAPTAATATPPAVGTATAGFMSRSRIRTSFDPELEIPRLQRWFGLNQHPSRETMTQYLQELNSLDSRKGRKPLDLTNIIYWFKNARAASRRVQNKSMEGDSEQEPSGEEECAADERRNEGETGEHNDEEVPDLPNRNAVYVINPNLQEHEELSVPEKLQHHHGRDAFVVCPRSPDDIRGVKRELEDSEDEADDAKMDEEGPTDLSIRDRSSSASSGDADHLNMGGAMDETQNNNEIKLDGYMASVHALSRAHAQNLAGLGHHPHMGLHPLAFAYPATASALYGLPPAQSSAAPQHVAQLSKATLEDKKKRSRVFIDPLTEIPKMEKWFLEDTHPSSYMIEKYTEELNKSEYRQRFPKLEPKNVQLWFKNHRAKVKRARMEEEGGRPLSPAKILSPSSQGAVETAGQTVAASHGFAAVTPFS